MKQSPTFATTFGIISGVGGFLALMRFLSYDRA